ncbi:MAG: hypothetical protein RMJ52_08330 [Gemmataceae bacterium]|nr:hypothetical protein [Gemmataceae bacterium]
MVPAADHADMLTSGADAVRSRLASIAVMVLLAQARRSGLFSTR